MVAKRRNLRRETASTFWRVLGDLSPKGVERITLNLVFVDACRYVLEVSGYIVIACLKLSNRWLKRIPGVHRVFVLGHGPGTPPKMIELNGLRG